MGCKKEQLREEERRSRRKMVEDGGVEEEGGEGGGRGGRRRHRAWNSSRIRGRFLAGHTDGNGSGGGSFPHFIRMWAYCMPNDFGMEAWMALCREAPNVGRGIASVVIGTRTVVAAVAAAVATIGAATAQHTSSRSQPAAEAAAAAAAALANQERMLLHDVPRKKPSSDLKSRCPSLLPVVGAIATEGARTRRSRMVKSGKKVGRSGVRAWYMARRKSVRALGKAH
jgi:hypothetical protein